MLVWLSFVFAVRESEEKSVGLVNATGIKMMTESSSTFFPSIFKQIGAVVSDQIWNSTRKSYYQINFSHKMTFSISRMLHFLSPRVLPVRKRKEFCLITSWSGKLSYYPSPKKISAGLERRGRPESLMFTKKKKVLFFFFYSGWQKLYFLLLLIIVINFRVF